MNIILLVIDTLRYDRVGFHGACPHIQTPNFDRLAAKSLVYDRAFASSFPTIPHRTDVMTGQYGAPFHPWAPLAFDRPFLPHLLEKRGYCTQLIHDTPHLVNGGHAFDYPFHAWTFVRGAEVDRPVIDNQPLTMLDNWRHDQSLPLPKEASEQLEHQMIVTYTRANRHRRTPEDWNTAKLFGAANSFLRGNTGRDNFFLWLDCFDPHEPWDAPPEFIQRYDTTEGYDGRIDPRLFTEAARNDKCGKLHESIVRRQTAMYDAKVSWVDHWFGTMLDTLEQTGLDKDTAVVLTADHGTNLYDWNRFGKTGPQSEYEAHVPLIVYRPGVAPARQDRIVQPQDITATLLDLAGASIPNSCRGVSVLSKKGSGRSVALTGTALDGWPTNNDWPAFTVFDQERYLMLAADPRRDRLYRYGSHDNSIAEERDCAAGLRTKALDELQRRNAPAEVVSWFRNNGKGKKPEAIGRSLRPEGWSQYFGHIWKTWQ
jgi:arylsulfatase A-like enzyme